MSVVTTILIIIAIYLVMGFAFAFPFLIKGVIKIDEGAQEATWGFRIIIIPGTIVFWPFLLRKWIHTSKKKRS